MYNQLDMIRYLIGVDDTDSLKTLTTGELMRQLAGTIQSDGFAEPRGVTRHQLLVKKQIPYTAHNSAICMAIDAADMEAVWETVRDFFSLHSERHANVGLGICRWDSVERSVSEWGRRAKAEVLTLDEAQKLATKARVRLVAIRGNGNGMIGALAAIGLHREGNDGRFLWLPGLLELQGTCSVGEIFERTSVDRVCTLDGVELPMGESVEIAEWTRPLLRNGQSTMYVEKKKRGWAVIDKERIKELSE